MTEPVPPGDQPATPGEAGTEPICAALFDLLYAFLLPLFVGDRFVEPGAADRAVRQSIRLLQPSTPHEAMLAARTVAYGLAAADNVRLSMAPDLSVAMKLRLRANANALERTAAKTHATLEHSQASRAMHADGGGIEATEAELADMLQNTKSMINQTKADIAAARAVAMPRRPAESARPAADKSAQAAQPGRVQTVAPSVDPVPEPAQAASANRPAQAAPARAAASATPAAAAQGVQPPRMADPARAMLWASAMTAVAEEMTVPHLSAGSSKHRRGGLMRANLLSSAARDVIIRASGGAPPTDGWRTLQSPA